MTKKIFKNFHLLRGAVVGMRTIFAAAFKGGNGPRAGGIGYDPERAPTLTAGAGSNLAPVVLVVQASENMPSFEEHFVLYRKLARMTREQGSAWLAEQPERTVRMQERLWHMEEAKLRKESLDEAWAEACVLFPDPSAR